jgi:hypothetical protein
VHKPYGAISAHYGIVVVGKRIRANYYNEGGQPFSFPVSVETSL